MPQLRRGIQPIRWLAGVATSLLLWEALMRDVRMACKESGHWWGDEPFILTNWKRQRVGERFQNCQRGCGRTRTSRISLRDGELIGSHVYGGNLDGKGYGRTPKSELRLKMMEN